jgi:hypothetical protein
LKFCTIWLLPVEARKELERELYKMLINHGLEIRQEMREIQEDWDWEGTTYDWDD